MDKINLINLIMNNEINERLDCVLEDIYFQVRRGIQDLPHPLRFAQVLPQGEEVIHAT